MSELKQKFVSIAQVALIEFSLNHPGHCVVGKMMEGILDLSEEEISKAYEAHEELSSAVDEYILYQFTAGRNGFKKPSWLN